MVTTTVLTQSGSVLKKAGRGVDPILAVSGAWIDEYINQAEGVVCAASRVNWVELFPTLNDDVKFILSNVTSDLAAIKAVSYNLSGSYSTRLEAEDIINVLRDSSLRDLAILREQKVKDFIKKA